MTNGSTVGQYLETQNVIFFTQVPANQTVDITISTSDPNLLLSATPTGAGSQTIILHETAGAYIDGFYVYGLASTGSAVYTATASGYGSSSDTVYFAPSTVILHGPGPCYTTGCPAVTSTSSETLTVQTYVPPSVNNTSYLAQSLAGFNQPLTIQLGNGSSAAGTVPSSVTIQPGTGLTNFSFTYKAPGSTVISVTEPTNFVSTVYVNLTITTQ